MENVRKEEARIVVKESSKPYMISNELLDSRKSTHIKDNVSFVWNLFLHPSKYILRVIGSEQHYRNNIIFIL